MKKSLLALVALITMSADVFADGLTATLQQGDKMTPFYGVDAFKDAYAAADSGAVITLSPGTFNNVDSIKKSIAIIGTYAFNANDSKTTILQKLVLCANNIHLEGIYISGNMVLDSTANCWIAKCWVEGMLSTTEEAHVNTVIDQCVVKNDKAISKGINYCIKNSTIGQFYNTNTSKNVAFITNSIVYSWSTKPYAIYKNNLLGGSGTVSCPSEFYYNLFSGQITYSNGCIHNGNLAGTSLGTTYYPGNPANPGNGQDGTPRGPNGGTGFSEWPNIPRITEQTIDGNTDANGKINVSIKVSVK